MFIKQYTHRLKKKYRWVHQTISTWLQPLAPVQQFLTRHCKLILATLGSLIGFMLCLIIANQIFFALLGLSFQDHNPLHFLELGAKIMDVPSLRGKWLLALFIPFGVVGALIAVSLQEQQRYLFGKAHWATYREAKKAGLFAKEGLMLGKKWGQYLRVNGFEHVFVFAPSGSGKSTALVIPNLLTWNGSCITMDVKLSLFQLTSKFRAQHGQQCFLWNPGTRDGHTHAYNPFDFVSQDKALRIDDLQKLAHIFIPDNPKQDPIWTAQPRVLFIALALYLLDTAPQFTEVLRLSDTAEKPTQMDEHTIILQKKRA